MKYLLIFFTLFLFQLCVEAQERHIEMEFDEIEGASLYEFEFRVYGKEEVYKTLSQKSPLVEVDLPYNHYEIRQRTKDFRKVPGAWSEWEKISISVPEAKFANSKYEFESKENDFEKIEIEWAPVATYRDYEIRVVDVESKKEVFSKVTSDKTKADFKVPVAAQYEVSVIPVVPKEIPSDLIQPAVTTLTVIAAPIAKPEIIKLKSPFSSEIGWEKQEHSQAYDIVLEQYDNKIKKWSTVYVMDNYQGTQLPFDPKWQGGKYSLKLKAKAKFRKPSSVVVDKFELAPVRTPAAEYNHAVTKAIDRVDSYYTQFSWLVTQFRLTSYSYDTSTQAYSKPLGGTLRAGGGYFRSNRNWGISGYLSTYHIILDGEDRDFASLDISGVYRKKFTFRDELRVSLGLTDKEIPVLIGTQFFGGGRGVNFSRVNVLGPKLAVEYLYSLGPKIGMQAHYSQNYFNLIKSSSSINGQRFEVPTSYQMGLMGSYQFTSSITGLLGITHQEEYYQYDTTSSAALSNKNNGSLKADYIGLMAEIGF